MTNLAHAVHKKPLVEDAEPELSPAEAEWIKLSDAISGEQVLFLADFVSRNKGRFVDVFYAQLMQNQDAAAFLSQKIVQDRLHGSLSNWLHLLFSRDREPVGAFAGRQRKVGEVHARIGVPIHVVMQGARLLKNEMFQALQQEAHIPGSLLHIIAYIGNAIDIALEIMSQAFVKDSRENAQVDEAYRAFTLSHDFPLERESQRAALMEWSQSLLISLYRNTDTPLPPLANSDFGLWLQHKADLMFSGSAVLAVIRNNMRIIDEEILPKIGVARAGSMSDLTLLLAQFQSLIGELKYHMTDLFQAASTMETGRDPLTRALNRRFMPPILSREVKMALQHEIDLSVMMIDIDHFKRINDTYGHSSGDIVLQQVAETIISICRASDFIFRYGGEEFLVALVEADEKRAFALAENLRMRVADQPVKLADGSQYHVTISIGVAVFNGHPDYNHLIMSADKALYRAKQAGRNRCEIEALLAIN